MNEEKESRGDAIERIPSASLDILNLFSANPSVSSISLSAWSQTEDIQIALSPIIQQTDDEFGSLHLSWDHSSDLTTPLYDEDHLEHDMEQSNLVHAMVEDILADSELDDDVFETLAEVGLDDHKI